MPPPPTTCLSVVLTFWVLTFWVGGVQDRAVCPFFSKTGACAYGGVCSRLHVYPNRSPTLLLPNMFRMPTPLKLPGDTSEEALMVRP